MARRDVSRADYLVDLCLKYFFRAVMAGLVLAFFIEGMMALAGLRQAVGRPHHVGPLILTLLSGEGQAGGGQGLVYQLMSAGIESLRLCLVTLGLVCGFGLPLGMTLGRLLSAGQGRGLWSLLGRVLLFPCCLLKGLPTVALAVLVIFYLIDFQELSVFDLIKNGRQNFAGLDARVAGWWRLLLPAAVVALSSLAWLVPEVARSLRSVRAADFVGVAEKRGLSGDYLYFFYVVKNSMRTIGSSLLRVLPFILSALILVEWVFRFPGLGGMIWQAATEHDFSRLLIAGAASVGMVLLLGFFVELLFGVMDGKTRREGGLSVMNVQLTQKNRSIHGVSDFRKYRVKTWRRIKQAYFVLFLVCSTLWGIYLYVGFRWGMEGVVLLPDDEGTMLPKPEIWQVLSAAGGTLSVSLLVSALAVLFSFCAAGLLGWLGGGRTYSLVAKFHGALSVIPVIFCLLVSLAVLGGGFVPMVLILVAVSGVLGVGALSRWFLDIEFQGWVEAARVSGVRSGQIYMRHFVAALWPRLLSRILLLLPRILLCVVVMDFSLLGGGARGAERWGTLVAEGWDKVWQDPSLLILSLFSVWGSVVFFELLAIWAKSERCDQLGPDIF